MLNQEMFYSEERQSWNLIVNGEWYFEGTYEQVEEAMMNNAICDAEDECGYEYAEDEYEDYLYEDDEPEANYWVSYALQDGSQMGWSLWVNDDKHAYEEIMAALIEIHGDELALIADYGKYED